MSFVNAGRPLQQELMLRADYTKKNPVLDALLRASAQNNYINVALGADMPFKGKYRQVVVNNYLPTCDPLADDCSGSICDAGETIEPSQYTASITECTTTKNYDLLTSDVRLIDGNLTFSDNVTMQILSLLNKLREGIAAAAVTKMIANMGKHNDGSTSKQISFTDPKDASIRPLGLWEIEREFTDLGLNMPYIIGGTDVFTWLKAVQYGGLNGQGIQTGQLPTSNMWYDALIDQIYADPTKGHVIAFDPNMIKFVAYNKNADMFATTPLNSVRDLDALYRTSGNSIKGTYEDPVSGLLFDLNVRRVDCPDDKFTFNLSLNWDLLYLPKYFCSNDGVNGTFAYTTCVSTPPECPTT